MAITALAPYKKFKRVEAVIDSCLKALMTTQTEDGTIDCTAFDD